MAKTSRPIRETDLYGPVRDYLVAQGYAVQAEVKDCDIAARKGDDLIIIELKRQFGVDLLIQATKRQRVTDSVYVALPGPLKMGRGSRWHGIKRLLRRLELGLIVVCFPRGRRRKDKPRVEIAFHPLPYARQKRARARRAILQEMTDRSGEYNVGGSTRRKIVTAYRENAILVACCLEKFGPMAPRQIRALGGGPKTLSILRNNHYGWFQRVETGVYALTAKGAAELPAFPDQAAHFRACLDG